MANLLLVYGRREPTNIMLEDFFLRMADFSEINGKLSLRSMLSVDIREDDIVWSDIVMAIRPQEQLTSRILKIAKKYARLCVVFMDDDFLAIEDKYVRAVLGEAAVKLAMRFADVIMGSNKHLVYKMSKLGGDKKAVIINTAIAENELHQPYQAADKQKIDIVYYVNDGNRESFEKIIMPLLGGLYEKYPHKIHWTFYTVHPDLSGTPYGNEVTYIDRMPLDEFRKSLADGKYDIGITPLTASGFNIARYVNHYFEYTRAGISGIYSDVPPYSSFIRNGKDGVLASNTSDGWMNAIHELMDIAVRRKISDKAQQRCREKFSDQAVIRKLVNDFPDLVSFNCKDERKIRGFATARLIDKFFKMICAPMIWTVRRFHTEGVFSVLSKAFWHRVKAGRYN